MRAKRQGFTLVEVLIAVSVMSIAMFGIVSAAGMALRKSGLSDTVEKASLLANDRLTYFRSQPDPYFATGGTYYPTPPRNTDPDFNTNVPGASFVSTAMQPAPMLFVREFLYGVNENLSSGAKDYQKQRFTGNRILSDEIPPTPRFRPTAPGTAYDGVVPSTDSSVGYPNPKEYIENRPLGLAATVSGTIRRQYFFVAAPQALAGKIPGPTNPIPDAVAFVREVWVQTNHPAYAANNMPAGAPPIPSLPLFTAEGLIVQTNLPIYTTAVTVRVYARNPKYKDFKAVLGPSAVPGDLLYDPTLPLAQVVGYFGLNNSLSP